MLENLLNTKLKKRILGIFFSSPDRSFSMYELKQMTGSSVANVQKAIKEFAKVQLVLSASRGTRRYFKINSRFRLYDELWDLLRGSEYEDVEDEVVKILKKLLNVRLAILSGIFTLQPRVSSDLLLIGEEINRIRLEQILSEIEKWTGQEINFSVMTRAEYEYRQLMNDRFIRDILDHPHLTVINTFR